MGRTKMDPQQPHFIHQTDMTKALHYNWFLMLDFKLLMDSETQDNFIKESCAQMNAHIDVMREIESAGRDGLSRALGCDCESDDDYSVSESGCDNLSCKC
jgi:hypothetical protein